MAVFVEVGGMVIRAQAQGRRSRIVSRGSRIVESSISAEVSAKRTMRSASWRQSARPVTNKLASSSPQANRQATVSGSSKKPIRHSGQRRLASAADARRAWHCGGEKSRSSEMRTSRRESSSSRRSTSDQTRTWRTACSTSGRVNRSCRAQRPVRSQSRHALRFTINFSLRLW